MNAITTFAADGGLFDNGAANTVWIVVGILAAIALIIWIVRR